MNMVLVECSPVYLEKRLWSQVTVAMLCHRQGHASNVLAYLSEPTVIVLHSEPGWLSYIYCNYETATIQLLLFLITNFF